METDGKTAGQKRLAEPIRVNENGDAQRAKGGQRRRRFPFLQRSLTYISFAKGDIKHGISRERVYQFHVVAKGPTRAVASQIRQDFDCPMCKFHGVNLNGLWIHWLTMHDEDFHFGTAMSDDNMTHAFAYRRSHEETTDNEAKRPEVGHSELIWLRNGTRGDSLATANVVRVLQHARGPYLSLPRHTAYHMRTFQTVKDGEWLASLPDSDDEADDSWMLVDWRAGLDEFSDVSPKEKQFFSFWTEFFFRNKEPFIRKRVELPRRSMTFIDKYALLIVEQGLEDELVSHLINLVDEGFISRYHLKACMLKYETLVSEKVKERVVRTNVLTAGSKKELSKDATDENKVLPQCGIADSMQYELTKEG